MSDGRRILSGPRMACSVVLLITIATSAAACGGSTAPAPSTGTPLALVPSPPQSGTSPVDLVPGLSKVAADLTDASTLLNSCTVPGDASCDVAAAGIASSLATARAELGRMAEQPDLATALGKLDSSLGALRGGCQPDGNVSLCRTFARQTQTTASDLSSALTTPAGPPTATPT